MEAQGLLHLLRRLQAEEWRTVADGQKICEAGNRPFNQVGGRVEIAVGEQRLQDGPVTFILFGAGQPAAKASVRIGEVQEVEPIAGVVRIAVKALGAQHLRAGLLEGHALAEQHDRMAELGHLCAFGGAGCGGRGQLHRVEKRLVVVLVGVDDVFLRVERVTCRRAVVVHFAAAERIAAVVQQQVILQVAAQANLDPVGQQAQPGGGVLRAAPIIVVGIDAQTADKTLAGKVGASVEGADAAHGVAQAVVKRADARARQVELGGIQAAGVACHFAKVPAFAVDIDAGSIDAVALQSEAVEHFAHRHHVGDHVVAHQVEAEGVDLVGGGPHFQRIEHELAHHVVLGGRVLAAGAGLDQAVGVEAVIVAGDNLVEHGVFSLPAGCGVVEDHIGDDAQPHSVERLHHLAIFQDARRAIGVGGIRPFGDQVVVRIVAPIKGVDLLGFGHHRLLFFRIGQQVRQVGGVGRLPGGFVLVDGGNVEGGQQVQVGQAGVGQRLEMRHRVGIAVGEGEVCAAVLCRHALVQRAEVAHVQFPDGDILRCGQRRLDQFIPAFRL